MVTTNVHTDANTDMSVTIRNAEGYAYLRIGEATIFVNSRETAENLWDATAEIAMFFRGLAIHGKYVEEPVDRGEK